MQPVAPPRVVARRRVRVATVRRAARPAVRPRRVGVLDRVRGRPVVPPRVVARRRVRVATVRRAGRPRRAGAPVPDREAVRLRRAEAPVQDQDRPRRAEAQVRVATVRRVVRLPRAEVLVRTMMTMMTNTKATTRTTTTRKRTTTNVGLRCAQGACVGHHYGSWGDGRRCRRLANAGSGRVCGHDTAGCGSD